MKVGEFANEIAQSVGRTTFADEHVARGHAAIHLIAPGLLDNEQAEVVGDLLGFFELLLGGVLAGRGGLLLRCLFHQKGCVMDEKILGDLVSELVESQGVALGLVVSAIAEQLDADQLAKAIQTRLSNASQQKAYPPLAARITSHALDAALAVAARQTNKSH